MPDPNTEKATGAIDAQTAARESDWRVRLSLAPSADYLYKAPSPGILAPLAATDGVVFPYTPGINISYAAAYDGVTPTHTNYKTTLPLLSPLPPAPNLPYPPPVALFFK